MIETNTAHWEWRTRLPGGCGATASLPGRPPRPHTEARGAEIPDARPQPQSDQSTSPRFLADLPAGRGVAEGRWLFRDLTDSPIYYRSEDWGLGTRILRATTKPLGNRAAQQASCAAGRSSGMHGSPGNTPREQARVRWCFGMQTETGRRAAPERWPDRQDDRRMRRWIRGSLRARGAGSRPRG